MRYARLVQASKEPENQPQRPQKARSGRILPVLLLAGASLLAAGLGYELHSLGAPAPSAERAAWQRRAGDTLPELWKAPEFAFVDQHGQPTTTHDFAGRVWIADFIYTQCTSACPLLSAKLVLLQRQLPDARLGFVSFSVDPEHDTPQLLEAYAREWSANDARWRLLSTDPKGLAALADGMRVAVSPTGDAANPILHTSLFFLVDATSSVRGVYDSADDTALGQLVADTKSLLGPAPAEQTAAQRAGAEHSGGELYANLGCAACHQNPRIAPSLSGLWGQSVALQGGGRALVDEAYLTESIVAPGAKVRDGYLNIMPAYGGQLKPEQVSALVQHLRESRAADPEPAHPTAAAEAARIVEDPICHMPVRVTAETPHVKHGGEEHYFCSSDCEAKYRAQIAKLDPNAGGSEPR
jgi:protein SCO1/2